MKLDDLARELGLRDLTPELADHRDREVAGGHASDMLSDVLANAPSGGVLVTIQVHLNVIAVAVHADLAAVIFAAGRTPAEDVRARALEERLPLFTSPDSAFDVAGKLYALGVRGRAREAGASA
jgi:hypothetical protein